MDSSEILELVANTLEWASWDLREALASGDLECVSTYYKVEDVLDDVRRSYKVLRDLFDDLTYNLYEGVGYAEK